MKIKFTKRFRRKLAKKYFLTKLEGRSYIHPDSKFETPCDLSDCGLSEHSIKMGAYSYAGKGLRVCSDVKIGRFCSIGEDVKIGLGSHPLDRFSTSPYFCAKNWRNETGMSWNEGVEVEESIEPSGVEIGDDVWIGANVCIKNGLKIGSGATIGAGAVVTKDVPEFAIVGGVPAKIIRYRPVQKKFAHEYEPKGILTKEDFICLVPFWRRIWESLK